MKPEFNSIRMNLMNEMFLRFSLGSLSYFICFLVLAGCEKQIDEKDYIAKVGDTGLTREELEKETPPQTSHRAQSVFVQEAVNRWIQRELLFLGAVDKGLIQDVDLERRLNDYRKSLYGKAYLDMYLSNRVFVAMDEVREQYNNRREEFRRLFPEVRLVHFLLDSEKKAFEVRNSLLQYSGEARRSLLGSFRVDVKTVKQGDLIPELDQNLFGPRQPRGVLGPYKSNFGYHVLEVYEFYPKGSYRGIDDVYDELSQQVFRLKTELLYQGLIDSLTSVYPTKINPDFFYDE